MKNLKMILPMTILVIFCLPVMGQHQKVVLNTDEVPEVTHVPLKDFPKDQVLPVIDGWGGLAVGVNELPAGTDFAPMLKGLKNDHCQVAHWGYIVKGSLHVEYEDGSSEVLREGEAYYMPPGHTGKVLEDLVAVEFSPEKGMHDLMEHLGRTMSDLSDN